MGQVRDPRDRPSSSGRAAGLGLIAGAGRLPLEAFRMLESKGEVPRLFGFEGVSDPAVAALGETTRLGQLGRLLGLLRESDVTRLLILGKFSKTLLFEAGGVFEPDAEAIELLAKANDWQDAGLMAGIADWLESKHLEIGRQDEWLPSMLATPGALATRPPSDAERMDAQVGFRVLSQLGASGAGQAASVRRGAVLALEAIEGTDAMIERAGELGGPGATLVKGTRPGQDRRFDLPAIGPQTIQAMERAGATALFVEAGSTLIVEAESMRVAADAAEISIWGFDSSELATP